MKCSFLEGLFPVEGLHHLLDFQIAFAGSGQVGGEVPDACHSIGWWGWHGETVYSWLGHKTADRYEIADFTTFTLLGPKNIFHFIM